MEIKEIKNITNWILNEVSESETKFIYRKFDTFLEWFGMTNKSKKILKKVDYQFKKNKISLHCNNEQRTSILDFRKGEFITFRLNKDNNMPETDFENTGTQQVKYKNAGTINIVNEESGIELYKHQEEAINNLNNKITKTNKTPFAGLVVLPTGGGKTLTAAYWLSKNILNKNKKILWIAHRHELLEQAKDTFHIRLAFKDIFTSKQSFNYRIISGIHDKPVNIKATDDIIISSKDSLNAGFSHLYNNWLKNNTDEIFLVIDEAHHATAKTYRKLIKNLQDNTSQFRMIGLTATPFRTAEPEKGLLAKVFPDDIIYKTDLRTLINRGILSKPIFEEVNTEFDMTKLLSDEELDNLNYFEIDSIGKATAKTIAENDQRNWCIVNKYTKNKNKYKQTIVFALNKDNAIALNKLFENAGINADYILSSIKDQATGVTLSSKENKDKIDRFRSGELDVLINVNILTEGTDLPNVQSIFLARPTISPILMTQMIGRGLRGEKAGGTKEAYIVSFIDEWKDKVSWLNPEKLIIEENIDFEDKDKETRKHLIRLIAINKIEEFAILTNKILDETTKEALEKLDFIQRLPLGIYHFSILKQTRDEESREKNCEVLVYSNIKQAYEDFIQALPEFFIKHNLTDRDDLTEDELDNLSQEIDEAFFYGTEKYPGYNIHDIKDILYYYAQVDEVPKYIELKDREKYNIDLIAYEIIEKDLGERAQTEMINSLWENNESEWKAFFGYNKKYFINEIDLAKRKLKFPEEYKRPSIVPTDTKELRKLEDLSMADIREQNPKYWKWLSDTVYEKYKDEDGYYFSAKSGYKSKNKLDFQIDHKKAHSEGGKTILENLRLLTIKENILKGNKIL